MLFRIILTSFAVSGVLFANSTSVTDRLEKDINYLDSKLEEDEALRDHDLGSIPETIQNNKQDKIDTINLVN